MQPRASVWTHDDQLDHDQVESSTNLENVNQN